MNAKQQWERANETSYRYYLKYLQDKKKKDKFVLKLEDLLYVRNFKGGNATINELPNKLPEKLKKLSEKLKSFHKTFRVKSLSRISEADLQNLIEQAKEFIKTNKEEKINGFGPSFASTLLHIHFPKLIPILDKRVVSGAGIPVEFDKKKNIKNLPSHYASLIKVFHKELVKDKKQTIRSLDKKLFSKKFPKNSL